MPYECGNCGNKSARVIQISYGKEGKQENCDGCGARGRGTPDVYFKGEYVDDNLASEQYPGPKLIRSRQEKKMWLEKCNLREAGDRHHGATSFDPVSSRHATESLRRKGYER